ncbi:MAG: helix-turn-helix domain-containing protein, partial [Pseudomonadota bacterium]
MGDGVRIPTNLRTLMILEVLGKSDKPMTPTEINAHIGLPKQTIHRLCNTLEAEGFIIQEIKG